MNTERTSLGGDDAPPQPVASYWHTAILVALFLLLTVGGALFQGGGGPSPGAPPRHPHVIPLYLSLLAFEWGLVLYVWRGGLRKSGVRLRELIGGRWGSLRDVARDVAFAIGAWLAWVGIQAGWDACLGPDQAKSVGAFLPQGFLEIGLWIALSISAGICEEFVFRGYLQRQFAALTRSPILGLILQSLLFGVSHGYQGVAATLKITLFGIVYGSLALWRRSLRPGMIAHAWSDIWAGWLGLL